MSSGTWENKEKKVRPGIYNRFISLANFRTTSTKKGIVALPIKADWGKDNEIVICESEEDIINSFGECGTVYLAKRAILGTGSYKPYRILLYRMTTLDADYATATLNDVVLLKAKYKGTRGNNFKVIVSENIIDSESVDVNIYEESVLISKYTVKVNDIDDLIEKVNTDKDSLIVSEKLKDGELSPISDISFSGGNSGNNVTSENYSNALLAFEAAYMNTIVLDNVSDSSIITMVKNWHNRVWNAGNLVQLVIGGSKEDDKDIEIGNKRSKSCDNYGIINVVTGGIDSNGNKYCSSEMAVQIAGAIAAIPLNASLTYKQLNDIVDITINLTNTQIENALNAGSFILTKDVDPETFESIIKVERGINTFTSFTTNAGQKLSKIKAISTMAAIDYDLGKYAMRNIIGEVDNTADGKAILKAGILQYLETLASENVISKDILVDIDDSIKTEDDVVYINTYAFTVDKIEQIFNTIYL